MRTLFLLLAISTLPIATTHATTLDLTTAGASGTIGDALFKQGGALSGTGTFPAFVQLTGNDPVKDAYNTTVNFVNDNGQSNTFNHEVQLATVPYQTISSIEYYSLFLDINEVGNASDRYLSLDALKIITSATPNQSTEPLPVGTLRYDMDAIEDSMILLNFDLEPGSGRADLELLVPRSLFAGALGTDYIYIWSQVGALGVVGDRDYGASNGFEEWARGTGIFDELPPDPPPDTDSVPEPATLLLFGAGLIGTAALRKRSRT